MNIPIKTLVSISAAILFSSLSTSAETPTLPYDGSWESLQQMPVPDWFDDGKIGIFIHWGPYSAIGYRKGGRGYAEHVPKLIYEDPKHYYPYLKERWGATPPEFGYKDIIPEFKAENWQPEQWAALFEEVGAKYVVLTAEHHDGWANWDSDLTPWNAVDKGPKRDLVGDLGKALRARGLKYAPSYHRERHTGFFAKEKYAVHSEPRADIVAEIQRDQEAAMLYGPEFSYSKAYVDDYVARWKEIQTKYQPDMLWVDDFPIYTRDGNRVRQGKAKPEIQYFDDQVRGMITDFMNDGAVRGQPVYVNNKGANRNWPDGVGCLEKDNLKLEVIGPKWQSCTTFGTSFGYLEGDRYKTVESVIHEMIEVISRNGNFLINIGPKADGTIPAPQVERLQAMGDWLRINAAAIYGSRYWKVSDQENEHLAFTTNGMALYAIKMAKPERPFTITATAGWDKGQVQSVRLLGSPAEVKWQLTPKGLVITPPANLGQSQHAWTFEIMTDREQHVPNVIQHDADKAFQGTKEVDLDGHDSVRSPRATTPMIQAQSDGSFHLAASKKPNILFIFSDDQMWNSLGFLEDCPIQTPNLDRLRNQGALFSHAYNMGSFTPAVCVASRTMLNTGSFVWRAAAFSPKGNNHKDPNAPKNVAKYVVTKRKPEALWSQFMQQAGYETYFSGKWHVDGYQPPFDHTAHVRGGMPNQSKVRYARTFAEGEPDTWSPYDKSFGGFWKGGKHWSEVLGDDGVAFLSQAKKSDQPFFMYLAFNAPHDPRQAPKEFVDLYPLDSIEVPENFIPEYPYNEYAGAGRRLRDERLAPFPRTERSVKVNRQEYYAIISHMDAQIGRILDALEASGKAVNTYIFFTSDHGLAVGDHGFIGKQNMYDSSMRVPLLMAGPGIEAGKTVDAPVYLQDVMATSLELAGVAKPAQVDFNSMLPLATGKTDQSAYDAIYGAYFGTQRMYRTDRYKMIIYSTANRVRLYDMQADSLEQHDLAQGKSRPVELLNVLFSQFKELQAEMDDPIDVTEAFNNFMNNVPPSSGI
ncbi:alpha-L-fucosidase [Coraliomargarita algicola]|uniref:alpha-L-fucosidase n=1 Tax=Coraliomargarita algicola TaxID=3092156 RepID=A0ABZ0RJ75_9BACT|nr:alpha-L-fucosidase [Coraliomargarita sp. J2-16]WPJ96255.1 alpha-L-fucosidase [Coraliomargarita sp. J2-16]